MIMGRCVICGKETVKVLYKDAIVKTYICSEQCLQKYFQQVGGVKSVQKKLKEDEAWLD